MTEVLSSNPTFGLNPLEKKSHNLILATVTLKAGYTGLILVLERAQQRLQVQLLVSLEEKIDKNFMVLAER